MTLDARTASVAAKASGGNLNNFIKALGNYDATKVGVDGVDYQKIGLQTSYSTLTDAEKAQLPQEVRAQFEPGNAGSVSNAPQGYAVPTEVSAVNPKITQEMYQMLLAQGLAEGKTVAEINADLMSSY